MLDEKELHRVVGRLRAARVEEWPRLAEIRRYLRNEVVKGDIYVPDEASDEYKMLVDQARFNITPMFVDSLSQNLRVDGYRPTAPSGRLSADNSPIWDRAWQPNRMDARQKIIHRAAAKYGFGYGVCLPGVTRKRSTPKITQWAPLRLTALYEDPNLDEWPVYAMTVGRWDTLDTIGHGNFDRLANDPVAGHSTEPVRIRVYDATHVYTLDVHPTDLKGDMKPVTVEEHGLDVCPVVRYLDELDDELPTGKVEPQLPIQRQVNQTTFGLLMTQQFQAFRQRWATGMAVETDDNGNPVNPFNAAADQLLANSSPDAKFGEFSEADLTGYLKSRDAALLFAAFTGQVSAHALMLAGGIANINADTLVALESRERSDIEDHQDSLGESHEQLLRLSGKALGASAAATEEDRELAEATWEDTSARVRWADTTPRSLAQIADALGKLATQLGIPVRALWERIPGVTDQDLSYWEELAAEDERTRMDALTDMMDQTAEAAIETEPSNGPGNQPLQV